ncbi:MAG: superoxide dismutase [Gammaproteobacteria bacterium]|nr:superoxide dismutase [Gammaproteobacteria bacterium]
MNLSEERGTFVLPELPYTLEALAPHISKETLEYHHGKHHKAYVDNLNKFIQDTEYQNMSLGDIIKKATGPIFNNAAQHWNHSFYWLCMTPDSSKAPIGKLADAIKKKFGSFDEFKKLFTESGTKLFGSGWTWLAQDSQGELEIINESNAGLPLKQNKKAIMTCDVWEHAYYIDYRNLRPKYIENFWDIINWDFAEKNFTE